jgi:hypothetical protein
MALARDCGKAFSLPQAKGNILDRVAGNQRPLQQTIAH